MEVGLAETDSGLGISLEDFEAESKARFGTPPSTKAAPEQPKEVEAASSEAVEVSTPEAETPEPAKLDLSWLPDDVRTDFEGLPSDVLGKVEKLKGHVLRQEDYTRKTQAVAAKDRALESERQKAVLWDALMRDEAKARRVMDALEGKSAAEAEPTKPFHWSTATDDEIEAEMQRRIEVRSKASAEALVEERFVQPATRAQAINVEVSQYLKGVEGLTDEQRIGAFRAAIDEYGERELLALDPAVVVKLVKPIANALVAESKLAALTKSKPTEQRAARATSLPGTGGVAPASTPKHVSNADASDRDKLDQVARLLSARTGRHVTAQDVMDSMGGG